MCTHCSVKSSKLKSLARRFLNKVNGPNNHPKLTLEQIEKCEDNRRLINWLQLTRPQSSARRAINKRLARLFTEGKWDCMNDVERLGHDAAKVQHQSDIQRYLESHIYKLYDEVDLDAVPCWAIRGLQGKSLFSHEAAIGLRCLAERIIEKKKR